MARVVVTFVIGAAPLFWQAAQLMVRGEYVTPPAAGAARRAASTWWRRCSGIRSIRFSRHGERAGYARGAATDRGHRMGRHRAAAVLFFALSARPLGQIRIWRAVGVAFLAWALGPFLIAADSIRPEAAGNPRAVRAVRRQRTDAWARHGRRLHGPGGPGRDRDARAARGSGAWVPRGPMARIAVVAFQYGTRRFRLTSLDYPPVYRTLAAAEPGAVCEVPFGVGDGLSGGVGSQRIAASCSTRRSTLTRWRVAISAGCLPARPTRLRRLPVTAALLQLSDGRPDLNRSADLPGPCRYLVVHRDAASAALRGYVEGLPLDRVGCDRSAI